MLPPCAEEVLDIPQAAWLDLQPHGCYHAFLLRDLAPHYFLFKFLEKYIVQILQHDDITFVHFDCLVLLNENCCKGLPF